MCFTGGKKNVSVDGDDHLKGPPVTSAVLVWECLEDVTSPLERFWPLVRVVLTHTLLDLIFHCQKAWFILTPGHKMTHIHGNLIKAILHMAALSARA